jgi:hypothetical protein
MVPSRRLPHSISRSRVTRPRFQDRLMLPLPDFPRREIVGADVNRHRRGRRASSAGPRVRIRLPPSERVCEPSVPQRRTEGSTPSTGGAAAKSRRRSRSGLCNSLLEGGGIEPSVPREKTPCVPRGSRRIEGPVPLGSPPPANKLPRRCESSSPVFGYRRAIRCAASLRQSSSSSVNPTFKVTW